MQALEANAPSFGCQFVQELPDADVAVTNDVFPPEVLQRGLPLLKRMDGVFFLGNAVSRNNPLNAAAQLATAVIFISEYSRLSYFSMYGEALREHHVVLNAADSRLFKKPPNVRTLGEGNPFIAAATHWGRPEKRLPAVLYAAQKLAERGYRTRLAGTLPEGLILPSYVQSLGYLPPPELAEAFSGSAGLLNFSYRDAAPKVVPEAICCGLPVLYANSGGTPEMAGTAGMGLEDAALLEVEAQVPDLSAEGLEQGVSRLLGNYSALAKVAFERPDGFQAMLEGYFKILGRIVC
jgi:glycosyltransferase involved in cell wall biosynthesis